MKDLSTAFINPSPVALGRQLTILGDGLNPEVNSVMALVGRVLAANTTYLIPLPVAGAGAIDVLLRCSNVTATPPTASIYKTMADGVTEKMGAAGASAAVAIANAFANAVQQTASITSLRGEQIVMLKIVTGVNAGVIFDQAEYSTL